MKVAAIQVELGKGSYERTIRDVSELVQEARRMGADIACLPEHWLLEYWKEKHDFTKDTANMAKTNHLFLITGGNYTYLPENPSEIRIRSSLISPDGEGI